MVLERSCSNVEGSVVVRARHIVRKKKRRCVGATTRPSLLRPLTSALTRRGVRGEGEGVGGRGGEGGKVCGQG
ncbi:hypothetical protein E2C01_053889 [Portunus trituberculatus]|uniref:Uncharacterized protein n=1 Tax=Portunus trituberculatus TaxID=210409 RepID=A0A5B7GIE7_PORTR|nr:hypothetical protein [Portunus trituberculatus]